MCFSFAFSVNTQISRQPHQSGEQPSSSHYGAKTPYGVTTNGLETAKSNSQCARKGIRVADYTAADSGKASRQTAAGGKNGRMDGWM
jgi:hypothetical protein